MHSNLRDQQRKIIIYIYIHTQISTCKPHSNHKPKIYDTHTKKKKESKYNIKDSLQIRRE